jgi:hypothetical protein
MSAQQPAMSREMLWIGAGATAGGLYFILVGLAVLPVRAAGATCMARCGSPC